MAFAHLSIYSATKAALEHFSKELREELRGDNIAVTTFVPGNTRTSFGAPGTRGDRGGVRRVARVRHLLGRHDGARAGRRGDRRMLRRPAGSRSIWSICGRSASNARSWSRTCERRPARPRRCAPRSTTRSTTRTTRIPIRRIAACATRRPPTATNIWILGVVALRRLSRGARNSARLFERTGNLARAAQGTGPDAAQLRSTGAHAIAAAARPAVSAGGDCAARGCGARHGPRTAVASCTRRAPRRHHRLRGAPADGDHLPAAGLSASRRGHAARLDRRRRASRRGRVRDARGRHAGDVAAVRVFRGRPAAAHRSTVARRPGLH